MNKISLLGGIFAAMIVVLSDVIVFGTNGMSERIFEELDVLIFKMVWAALPFVIFAIVKRRTRKRAIGTGVFLTALAWAWFTWDGWSYIALDKVGGANIGLGMIMLVWPTFVFIIMMTLTIRKKWELPHDEVREEGLH